MRQLGADPIGGMGPSIVFGVLIVLALDGSHLLSRIPKSTRGTIEVAAGALLLGVVSPQLRDVAVLTAVRAL